MSTDRSGRTPGPSKTSPSAVAHGGFAYRHDIDGLRAIAVLAVVIYHAGISGVPGGFVGVDVFFVISGYLIGGQIFREARADAFSYVSFYARRTRRILPALFALLLTLYVAGLILMTPLELRELGKEAVATLFGASNILFYTGGDYFAPAADLKPLLMTWSLGVEEQFYLLFPFVALAILRFRRAPVVWVLVGLSVLSFVGSLVLMDLNAKAAFYLLPTRAWELGIGAALALHEPKTGSPPLPRQFGETGAVVGVLMLVGAVFLYREEIAFPGYFAVVPTLGTALLIATRGSLINTGLLARRPMVFVGKVSYSWYLWHWPLFYLYRVLDGEQSLGAAIALLLTSFVLAALSWKYVEGPFRRRILSERKILACYAAAAVAVAAPGVVFYLNDGVPARLTTLARVFARDAERSRADPCLASFGATAPRLSEPCATSSAAGAGTLAVLGDSHASSISPGLRQLAGRQGLGFVTMTKSSCPPLWGYAAPAVDRPGHVAECTAFQARVFDHVEQHPEVRVVALAGYWSSGMMVTSAVDGRPIPLSEALAATIDRLHALGRQVVLVQDVPTYSFDPYSRVMGRLNFTRAWLSTAVGSGLDDSFGAPRAEVIPDPSRTVLTELAVRKGVALLDPMDGLCEADQCRFRTSDALFYSDFQHLTQAGARAAVRGFEVPTASQSR